MKDQTSMSKEEIQIKEYFFPSEFISLFKKFFKNFHVRYDDEVLNKSSKLRKFFRENNLVGSMEFGENFDCLNFNGRFKSVQTEIYFVKTIIIFENKKPIMVQIASNVMISPIELSLDEVFGIVYSN